MYGLHVLNPSMELNMKDRISYALAILTATLLSLTAYAEINPNDLIKVTKDTTKKCVEYYSYKGEMYCSTKALSPNPASKLVKSYEKQVVVFDDRAWHPAWGKQSSTETTVEYVPLGDDINNWHELVTSQFFGGIQDKASPKQFADMIIVQLSEQGFAPIVTFHQQSPDQVIFEFQIDKPKSQTQDELQMVTKGKDGLYILHYAIKKQDMGKADRDKWLQNFSQSHPK